MLEKRKNYKNTKTTTLIGQDAELIGNIKFSGGLRVDGAVHGNVFSDENSSSVLTLSERGVIEGEVNVPNVEIDGTVIGDVHAKKHVELQPNARITGNVYYTLIEMSMGAEVNGNLVRQRENQAEPLKLQHDASRAITENNT